MTPGPWKDRAAFEIWWRQNVIAFNRLAVTDQVSAQTDMQWAERLAKDGLGPTAWERACAWARGEVDAYPERAR